MIEREKLLDRAIYLGKIIRERFEEFQKKYSVIKDVRGVGAMQAIEFVKDYDTWEPDAETCQAVIQEALKNGVVLAGAGLHKNIIRLLIPLVITEEQLKEGLDVLDKAIEKVTQGK